MIGAGSPHMLTFAAETADIIALIPPVLPGGGISLAIEAEAMNRQVAQVRDAARARFAEIELNVLLQDFMITDDREQAIDDLAPLGEAVSGAPHHALCRACTCR